MSSSLLETHRLSLQLKQDPSPWPGREKRGSEVAASIPQTQSRISCVTLFLFGCLCSKSPEHYSRASCIFLFLFKQNVCGRPDSSSTNTDTSVYGQLAWLETYRQKVFLYTAVLFWYRTDDIRRICCSTTIVQPQHSTLTIQDINKMLGVSTYWNKKRDDMKWASAWFNLSPLSSAWSCSPLSKAVMKCRYCGFAWHVSCAAIHTLKPLETFTLWCCSKNSPSTSLVVARGLSSSWFMDTAVCWR